MSVDDPGLVVVVLIIVPLIPMSVSSTRSTLALSPRLDLAISSNPRKM
jgi:hypothetical protein